MLDISLSELLTILVVGMIVLKPSDFIKIIHKIKILYKDFRNASQNEDNFIEDKYFDYLNQSSKIEKSDEEKEK